MAQLMPAVAIGGLLISVLERWIKIHIQGLKSFGLSWSEPCYLPALHGLPDVQDIHVSEPNYLVFMVVSIILANSLVLLSKRFGEVLHANADAVLFSSVAIPFMIRRCAVVF